MAIHLQSSYNQFFAILERIDSGEIRECDGFQATEPLLPFIQHYFVYGYTDERNVKWFFITMHSLKKVTLVTHDQILNLAIKHNFTLRKVIPFKGSKTDRKNAFIRGLNALGKPYKWIGANCENLLNYIQTGKNKSTQTRIAGCSIAGFGLLLTCNKSRILKWLGILLMIIGGGAFLVDKWNEDNF